MLWNTDLHKEWILSPKKESQELKLEPMDLESILTVNIFSTGK